MAFPIYDVQMTLGLHYFTVEADNNYPGNRRDEYFDKSIACPDTKFHVC